MKLTFHGAAGIVTGSCFLLEAGDLRLLIDCGLFQGSKALNERNYGDFPFDPRSIDCVLLTHAHIDHSGLLPKLVRLGFQGPIYATAPTKDLLEIMLADSAHIQEIEVARLNRRRARRGEPLLTPIYTTADAQQACAQVETKPMGQPFRVLEASPKAAAGDLTVTFWPAGHMLGAASISVRYAPRDGEPLTVTFSGDIGGPDQPLIVDAARLPASDVVVMESTYGDRLRIRDDERYTRLANIVRETFARGGNVIIPAFAVGRVQDLLYGLHRMIHSGELDPANIFVDSPLAVKATDIFCQHVESFDEEARRFASAVGDCPLYLRDLRLSRTQEESMAINRIRSGALIISSSGMCEAGRIKHHLRHNLWREECSVVFVSYQAVGTLGRQILDGSRTVRIHGEPVAVKAEIHHLEGFSAHADQEELLAWARQFDPNPKRIYLVHGEPEAQEALKRRLESELAVPVRIPSLDESVELTPADAATDSTISDFVAPSPGETDRIDAASTGLPAEPVIGDEHAREDDTHDLWLAFNELKTAIEQIERQGGPRHKLIELIDALHELRRRAAK